MYSFNILNPNIQQPRKPHLESLRFLQYLKGSPSQGIEPFSPDISIHNIPIIIVNL